MATKSNTVLVGILAVYFVLATGLAITKRPWLDEAWSSNPGANLVLRGHMGTTILEMAGTGVTGLAERTYMGPPLYFLAVGFWYEIFGVGITALRMMNVLWGAVALLAWFTVLERLARSTRVALLGTALTGLDFLFLRGSADGRSDIMCVALGLTGMAAYLALREKRLNRALLVGHALTAASGMTHPVGIVPFAGLLFLSVYLDRSRLRWKQAGLMLLPYLAAGTAWGVYILQSPGDFYTQFVPFVLGRTSDSGSLAPWTKFWTLIETGYAPAFGLTENWTGVVNHGRILILASYLVGVAGCLAAARIRRHSGYRALLMMTAIMLVVKAYSVGGDNEHDYVIHFIPLYAGLLAAWLDWLFEKGKNWRRAAVAGCCGLLAVQVGGAAIRIGLDPYHKSYAPVVGYLQTHTRPGMLIMGPAELGFGLRFPDNLVTDSRFGWISGKRPDVIVTDASTDALRDSLKKQEPDAYRHVTELLNKEFTPVFKTQFYTVYARPGAR